VENNSLPSLNQWDLERLRKSIEEIGIQIPIVVDQNGRIIDGNHRSRLAEELGVECPTQVIQVNSEKEFEQLAVDLNLARRHLSIEQIKEFQKQRKELALKLRENGATQKEAADAVGIGQSTINLWESESCSIISADNAAHSENKPKKAFPDNRIKIDKSLYEEIWEKKQGGETVKSLADAYGVSKRSIASICAQVTKKKNQKEKLAQAEKDARVVIENKDIENMILGDFSKIEIPDNSVDLILTDPPYGGEFSDTWAELGKFAARVLKPSRFLVTYFGQLNLIEFINSLEKHLKYYWTFCLIHSGNLQLIMPRNIRCGWKPILVFQKAPFSLIPESIDDVIMGSGRDKGLHEWQQSLVELDTLIEHFSNENELIVDPFAGSGTTIIAALKNKRRALGIEINKDSYDSAVRRINEFRS